MAVLLPIVAVLIPVGAGLAVLLPGRAGVAVLLPIVAVLMPVGAGMAVLLPGGAGVSRHLVVGLMATAKHSPEPLPEPGHNCTSPVGQSTRQLR